MAHQVSYDARKAKKRKRSCSQNKSNLSTLSMIISCVSANCKLVKTQRCLLTFLLLCLPGAAALTLQGQKDGTVTFPCSNTRENVSVRLTYGSKIAYGISQNREYHGRVQKSGNCNLTLQKLRTTDAGRYILHLYDNGVSSSNSYDVHIICYISGWKGKELMFDELPQEAERVEHYSATGWTEMWRREQDVNRLTDKNGFLTINNFTSSDAGTYRVLNEGGVTLVTVIITEAHLQEISLEEEQITSGSSMTTVCWISALPLLIYLLFGCL
ncbi:uncharacterized protein LOC125275955 isoform X2 [Megalobrama amblycephala]|nr:uncharacterized protein LOC125275955 isoform X2 [Megalobrama amblycephala]XP_048059276.1 uncharacterized protein LOC125275955 isoform X2 [Megalobrama amblycephala]XP_048059277.1 uncharacterized protein LOC125275955 isoform X2 [Megalobrama amblycephala]